MAERPTPSQRLEFYNPTDTSIDKRGVREFASDELAKSQARTWNRLASLAASNTLSHTLGYRTPEQQEEITQNLERIQQVGQTNAQAWNRDNYLTSQTFEDKINEKAQEYAEGHEDDTIGNYWKALGNRHDQALAVASFQKDFSDQVNNLREISDEDKDKAAYYLAENIRRYGADLANAESRARLIESGAMSQDQVDAALKAGLVQHADVAPQFNPEQATNGFANDEAWNEAVYKVAAGVLEDRLVKQIEDLSQVDEAAEILRRAEEIYNQRINAVAENPSDTSAEAPAEEISEQPVAEENAPVETTANEPEQAQAPVMIATRVSSPAYTESQIAPELGTDAPHSNGTNGYGHRDIPGTIHLGPAVESPVATMARATGENPDEVNAVLTRMRNGENTPIDSRIRPGEIEDDISFPDSQIDINNLAEPTTVTTVSGNTTDGDDDDEIIRDIRNNGLRVEPTGDEPGSTAAAAFGGLNEPDIDDTPEPAWRRNNDNGSREAIDPQGTEVEQTGEQADANAPETVAEAPTPDEVEEVVEAVAAGGNGNETQQERLSRYEQFLQNHPRVLAIRDAIVRFGRETWAVTRQIRIDIARFIRHPRRTIGQLWNGNNNTQAPADNGPVTEIYDPQSGEYQPVRPATRVPAPRQRT